MVAVIISVLRQSIATLVPAILDIPYREMNTHALVLLLLIAVALNHF